MLVRVKNMPVDLLSLPEKAARLPHPSIKRWGLFFILIFLLLNIFNHFLYMEEDSKPTIYLFFLTVPIWGCLYAISYFIYLLGKWSADGWDNEREIDKQNRITRGQRKITLLSQSLFLPHITNCSDLSTQILDAKKTFLLPCKYNNQVIYSAHFFDIHETIFDRVINRLDQLLNTPTLSASIHQLSERTALTIILSLGESVLLNETNKTDIREKLVHHLERPFKIHFQQQVDSLLIDNWLDNTRQYDALLLINIRLFDTPTNHQSEAALAQLFSSSLETGSKFIAYVHRPEVISNLSDTSLNDKLDVVTLWANTSPEKFKHLWLTTPPDKESSRLINKAPLLPNYNHLKTVDINNVIGHTGHTALWLNLFISTTQFERTHQPQLIIDEKIKPHTSFITIS